jgi:protein-S-isoprenylcysteine O-methyltransferase Ste14
MDSRFFVFAGIFLFCLLLRSGYEWLKDSGKIDMENKPVFYVIFAAMCILWVSWFSLCPLDPLRMELPTAIRWMGLAIFALGTILAVGALIQLRGVENIQHLVTTGLFAKFRHPMYMGFISWLLGWSIFHGAVWSFAIGLVGITNVLWWRRLEEARLEAQHGAAYQKYRLTTWF